MMDYTCYHCGASMGDRLNEAYNGMHPSCWVRARKFAIPDWYRTANLTDNGEVA